MSTGGFSNARLGRMREVMAGYVAAEGQIELRQLFELDDFAAGPAIDTARRLEEQLATKK